MKYSLLCILLSCLGLASFSQSPPLPEKRPMVIVDGQQTDMQGLLIDAKDIESINILKDSAAIAHYGKSGENGVIVMQTRNSLKLLRLNAILDKFNVADSLRKYRICINEVIIREPALILADPGQIESVSTLIRTDWGMPGDGKSENFLNIVARHPTR